MICDLEYINIIEVLGALNHKLKCCTYCIIRNGCPMVPLLLTISEKDDVSNSFLIDFDNFCKIFYLILV